jgi:hypothetical protein
MPVYDCLQIIRIIFSNFQLGSLGDVLTEQKTTSFKLL